MGLPIADRWFERNRIDDAITLLWEPHVDVLLRCNIWHVRGRDRDMLVDSGMGVVSLRAQVPLVAERDLVAVASHTHFDHIGSHHEFQSRCVHRAEAAILADPQNALTLAEQYATDEMFDRLPRGWNAADYRVRAAPAERLLAPPG